MNKPIEHSDAINKIAVFVLIIIISVVSYNLVNLKSKKDMDKHSDKKQAAKTTSTDGDIRNHWQLKLHEIPQVSSDLLLSLIVSEESDEKSKKKAEEVLRARLIEAEDGRKCAQVRARDKNQKPRTRKQAISNSNTKYAQEQAIIEKAKQQEYSKKSQIKTLDDFEYKEGQTWGQWLNPRGSFPRDGFQAYYLKTSNLKQVIAKEKVRNISIRYSWSEFHSIPSQDFSAYYTGNLYVPSDGYYQFKANLSWSKMKVYLDNRMIIPDKDQSDKSKTLIFIPAGNHNLEVEYTNNWHTTEMSLNIQRIADKID